MPKKRSLDHPKSLNGVKGAIAELAVAADLLKRGYEVFRAQSSTCSCDLIAMIDSEDGTEFEMLRIEVRTAGIDKRDGRVCYRPANPEYCDVAAIYQPWNGEILYGNGIR